MKKLIILAMLLLPTFAMAQSEWERPAKSESQPRKALFEKKNKTVDPKYLAGAVPEVDGKVCFTLDLDAPGKSAQQIYDTVYAILEQMTKEEKQFEQSQIALVNKADHMIAAKYREWLVFKSTALALDRTVFNYTIIANCSDGHLNLTLSRISYAYELDRYDSEGLETSAEEWITDKEALNKAKTKLNKVSGKFRRKTIDRKDEIFANITEALKK
ncbi:MAG: DUF4468 domain-containing protein [Prevotella sp.]|nr:DUF4468 domain-containing protein [Prevotella sp.]